MAPIIDQYPIQGIDFSAMPFLRRLATLLALTSLICGPSLANTFQSQLYDLAHDWRGDNDKLVKLSKWRGQATVLTMEYSNCRFLCSITLLKLKEIQAELNNRKVELPVLVVSIDPKNDTPETWTRYRDKRDLHYPNWQFLTGSKEATEHLASLLNVKYWFYGEHLMHDFRIVLIAPDGRIIKSMDAYDVTASEFLEGLTLP